MRPRCIVVHIQAEHPEGEDAKQVEEMKTGDSGWDHQNIDQCKEGHQSIKSLRRANDCKTAAALYNIFQQGGEALPLHHRRLELHRNRHGFVEMDPHTPQLLHGRGIVARIRIAVAGRPAGHGSLQVHGKRGSQASRGAGLAQTEHEPPPKSQLKERQEMATLLVVR